MSELTVIKIHKDVVKFNILWTLAVIFWDESGQIMEALISVFYFIFIGILNNNINF